MFRNTPQNGFLSVLYSLGTCPLAIWDQKVKNGHIRRVTDEDVKSLALEISGTNVMTTYIACPGDSKMSLGIRLPFFVMIVKNMKRYFTFEIKILDDKQQSRRFRVSNYQSTTRVKPFCTTMPIGLSSGWNQIQFNLADFTRRAYGSTYMETLQIQIHANVRIRRIYFCDRLYSEDEMPKEFKLYLPLAESKKKEKKEFKDQGVDARKASKDQLKEVIPSGAPPTPTGSAREVAQEAGPEVEIEVTEKLPEGESVKAEDTGAEEIAAETADVEEDTTEAPDLTEGGADETEPPTEAVGEETVTEPIPETGEAPAEDLPAEGEIEEPEPTA